jgi:hypothetical protein
MLSDDRALSRLDAMRVFGAVPLALAATLTAAGKATAATAEGHIPPGSVQYQATPKNGQQCSTCAYYINNPKGKTAIGGCTQVSGPIAPAAWCVIYAKGDNAKQTL